MAADTGAKRWNARLKVLRDEQQQLFDDGESGETLVRRMCAGVDELLAEMWREIVGETSQSVDLLAVGGYGRGELCPHSDWDLWFLLREEPEPSTGGDIERFVYALWDMNIKLGHAVRTVAQTLAFVQEDWHTATAALEARLVCGGGEAFADMQERLGGFFTRRRKAFVEAKLKEMHERHVRAGDTAFLMEPDIKESKGGLRDVQTVFWLAKAWHGCDSIAELVRRGAISETEKTHLVQAQDFLWRCRVGLHLFAGRTNDRLGFEQQMELAERMGYRHEQGRAAVEVFMKDYFRHAGRIQRVSGLLYMHFQEELHPQWLARRKDIGDGFMLEGKRVGVRDAHVFGEDKLRLLRIFHVAQQGRRRLSSQALRQVREHVLLIDDAFRADARARRLFMAILRERRNVATALKEMNDTGVLGRFIPEFRHAVGLGQFNNYHAYTVDEHTIRAVGEARNMLHHLHEQRLQLADDVFSRLDRPELLYLALICHDIAKGMRGDHSELGAEIAGRICARLDLSRDARDLVVWLVRHHLLMAVTSQRCDLADEEVIRRFAGQVGDMERLNYLLCLSVADIAAVGPGVWNEWKGTLLSELYRATKRHLMGEDDATETIRKRVAVRIGSTLDKFAQEQRAGMEDALRALPWRAIMGFPPRQLAHIGRLLLDAPQGGVDALVDEARGESLMLVLARDRKGLLADLTAALSSGFVNIVAAQAFMLDDGRVLDVFHLQDADGNALSVASDLDRLKERLMKVLEGQSVAPVRQSRTHILLHRVKVSVRPLPLASSRQTAIEVSAADRPGLLAAMAGVIDDAGFSVRGANISTFGERVVDVFFLTRQDGEMLDDEEIAGLSGRLAQAATLPEAA